MIARGACTLARGLGPVLAVLAVASTTGAQPAPAPPLPLETAVAEALQQNRPLQAERLGVNRASEELAAFRTKRMPLFDVTVRGGTLIAPLSFRFATGVFGTFPGIGPVPPANTTIDTNPRLTSVVVASVVQPLTQLRRISFGEQALAIGRDMAAEQVRARESEVSANAKKLYYGIVQAEAGLRAREESVRLYRELARVVDQYAAERAVLSAEALEVRAGLMQQEHELQSIRRTVQGYREQLNALRGRDLDEAFTVEPLRPTPVDGDDLQAAEARALASRPEVRLRRLQSEQAGFALKATETPGMPDVSLAFNYLGFYGFEILPNHGALVGVQATWEPWDWGRRRAEREGRRLAVEQSGLAAREAEALVRVDVRARFRAVQEAFDRIPVCEAARDVARERLRVATERLSREAALERDLVEAQSRLAQSDLACQQALAGYWTARAELERARADQ